MTKLINNAARSLAIVAATCSAVMAAVEPKNAILILVDDMGYGDVAAHGNPVLKTPNMDELHSQSSRFTNFAVSPTCAPTRAALLTGKHEFKSCVTHTIRNMNKLDLASTTIAELFKKKGFKTGMFGKWHLGQDGRYGPWFRGFDETLSVSNDSQHSHFDPTMLRNRQSINLKGYRTDVLFDEAMTFIERNRKDPFFCYLATYTPHAPLLVPEKYSAPYEGLNGVNAGFSGMVANVDMNLGRLMRKLKDLGLESNTLLVFVTDNGGTFGVDVWNAGMLGRKGSAWFGGIRAVSWWRAGDFFPAGDRGHMTGHVDVFPTLADIFKLDIGEVLESQLDGGSLLPLLEDKGSVLDEERMQVHHRGRWDNPADWVRHKYTHCCVRWNNYQLTRVVLCDKSDCSLCRKIRTRGTGGSLRGLYSGNPAFYRIPEHGIWELHDIVDDPFMARDLAKKKPELAKKMADHYESWWEDVSAVLSAERLE